jgi:hypothetical protein
MQKRELTIAALGLIVAALALIPAFGQWLFPREPIPVVATPTPLPPTPQPAPIDNPANTPTPTEAAPPAPAQETPTPTSPAPTTGSSTLSPVSNIAAECRPVQSLPVDLPLSPLLAFNVDDAQLRDDAQLAKELVLLSMQVAIQAAAEQNPRCLGEVFAGAALDDIESAMAEVSSTGVVSVPWIEWSLSQLREVNRVSEQRIEARVCLYQSLNVYSTLGVLIASYPAEVLAATYVFEQVGGDRYYATELLELDPFAYCQ